MVSRTHGSPCKRREVVGRRLERAALVRVHAPRDAGRARHRAHPVRRRLVRERLTELELAYYLHNLGKEQRADIGPAGRTLTFGKPYAPVPGGKREQLLALGGQIQVPYLIDPNTGVALYESRAILAYLDRTYAR